MSRLTFSKRLRPQVAAPPDREAETESPGPRGNHVAAEANSKGEQRWNKLTTVSRDSRQKSRTTSAVDAAWRCAIRGVLVSSANPIVPSSVLREAASVGDFSESPSGRRRRPVGEAAGTGPFPLSIWMTAPVSGGGLQQRLRYATSMVPQPRSESQRRTADPDRHRARRCAPADSFRARGDLASPSGAQSDVGRISVLHRASVRRRRARPRLRGGHPLVVHACLARRRSRRELIRILAHRSSEPCVIRPWHRKRRKRNGPRRSSGRVLTL